MVLTMVLEQIIHYCSPSSPNVIDSSGFECHLFTYIVFMGVLIRFHLDLFFQI